jgi:hypothetical protein
MAHCDTILISVDDSQHGMYGMLVACVLLFFSFHDVYLDKDIPCALVNWFIPNGDEPDKLTGMWVVETEHEGNTHTLEVIHLDTIVRGTHLLLRSLIGESVGNGSRNARRPEHISAE